MRAESKSSGGAATVVEDAAVLKVETRTTAPIAGQKPGTSGLRKKTAVWQEGNYTANFVTVRQVLHTCEGVPDTSRLTWTPCLYVRHVGGVSGAERRGARRQHHRCLWRWPLLLQGCHPAHHQDCCVLRCCARVGWSERCVVVCLRVYELHGGRVAPYAVCMVACRLIVNARCLRHHSKPRGWCCCWRAYPDCQPQPRRPHRRLRNQVRPA